nr:Mu transposase C-terminal domain-containing protein [Mycoplana azooxidifex]
MWERGSQHAKGSINPPPNEALYREIFGSTILARVGNEGIELFGNNYSNPKLLEIRKKWFDSTLVVRLNEEDISTISVKHKLLNRWINVPAVHSGLVGKSLEQWNETVRYIRKNIGHQDKYSEEIVLDGLQAAIDVVQRTERRPGAILHEDPGERLRKFQAEVGAFKWDQGRARDYGRESAVVEQVNDVEPEFLTDFEHEVFGEQEPLSNNGVLDRQAVDRHWESSGEDPYATDGSEYDTTHFVSAEDRLLPPDQRGGGKRPPKPSKPKTKKPNPAAGNFTVMSPEKPETRGPETPVPPDGPTKPYGFKKRSAKEKK